MSPEAILRLQCFKIFMRKLESWVNCVILKGKKGQTKMKFFDNLHIIVLIHAYVLAKIFEAK